MQDGSSLVVPELLYPVAPAISRHADRLDAEVADWARENGLCDAADRQRRLADARFGTLAARTCPDADLDRLTHYARWWAFGFFYTDEFFAESVEDFGRRRTAADVAMAVVSAFVPGGMRSGLPRPEQTDPAHRLDVLTRLLADTARFARRSDQVSRFGTALTLCLSRHLHRPPAPAGPAFVSPYLILGQIIAGCRVSGAELAHDDLVQLTTLAGKRTAWCERIHAAARRDSYGELVASLPDALRLGADAHPQRALDRAARLHDEATRAYGRLERALSQSASPGVRDYLAFLAGWTRGHHDWCRDTLTAPEPAADAEALGEVRIVLGPATPRAGQGARAVQGC